MDQTISPQSQRLKAFIQETGMSVTEFGNQCKIKSSSSLHGIVSEGKAPSSKVLDKIITRFPQLNHDWVILGYGEMIIPGMTKQPASGTSVLKSKGAAFQQIADKQIETSFGINELALKVEQAMALNAQTTQLLTNKVEQMSNTLKEAQESILINQSKRDAKFQQAKKDHLALINKYNDKREEAMRSEFFNLSDKVRSYLEDSRALMIKNLDENSITRSDRVNKRLAKFEETTIKQMNKTRELVMDDYKTAHKKSTESMLKVGLEATTEATRLLVTNMDKNAVKQTDIAIKQFISYFSPKTLLSKIGGHSVNKKS